MRADLTADLPALRDDVQFVGWEGNEGRFFQAYVSAFADRPGFPDWS